MTGVRTKRSGLRIEQLEARDMPSITATLAGGVLLIEGDDAPNRVVVARDVASGEVIVRDRGQIAGRFANSDVSSIEIRTGSGNDRVHVTPDVTQPVEIDGGDGNNILIAGGGPSILRGGAGTDKLKGNRVGTQMFGGPGQDMLVGGVGPNSFDGGPGADQLRRVAPTDNVVADPDDLIMNTGNAIPGGGAMLGGVQETLTAAEVSQLLDRAAAASVTTDAIIAVVDRNGRILGVRVEGGVAQNIQNDPGLLTFAIDGAVAKARTAAYFANTNAPLTSRTIRFISQSTITERMVNSNPSITDPNSTERGPGFVAPVGTGGHFPPGIALTPQVDLFAIEHTNRDSIVHPGPDGIKGTADDVLLPARFNIDPTFIPPGQDLDAPESYGFQSGIAPGAQSRGIATLPGGIPLYRNGAFVGGIGVFFPGTTGYASEENSALSTAFDPTKPDRALEAEWIAFAAAGGIRAVDSRLAANPLPIDDINGVPPVPGFGLPNGRIDLVGITLDIYGPGGAEGVQRLVNFGLALGFGDPNSGQNVAVSPGPDGIPGTADDILTQDGRPSPEGWLVMPHDGVGITAQQVEQIITKGIIQALQTRAAIRLPLNTPTSMVFAVTDKTGEVLGLFRMPDATYFSIDVAVAKARNVAYYADASALQPEDQLPGVPPGTAFTNRSFRYLAEPRFPVGIDGTQPAPFSVLNDGGADPLFALQVGPPLPASAHQSPLGFDAFNPGTNFRDPDNILNQNGVVWFPGSAPLYTDVNGDGIEQLVGGFGVSGDGVDQDDVVTFQGARNFGVPNFLLRSDEVLVRDVRIPYQKFNRNPEGGLV